MKMVKSLLLGSAAGLVAMTGAQAADLPVKAKPVQYVKICSLYGAGFYYVPGTDLCLKIGGWVRQYIGYGLNGSATYGAMVNNVQTRGTQNFVERVRGYITADARSQTEWGTLRSYIAVGLSAGGNPVNLNSYDPSSGADGFNANRAFVQFAGFTFGLAQSFYDLYPTPALSYFGANINPSSDTGDAGKEVTSYTAQFGNGFSATIGVEGQRNIGVYNGSTPIIPTGTTSAASVVASTTSLASSVQRGEQYPDVVGNLRIDQAWGSAQVMGALHDASAAYYGATDAFGGPGSAMGWALGAGVKLNAPMIGPGDYFSAQFNYTQGAGGYANAVGGAYAVDRGQNFGFGVETDNVVGGSVAAGTQTGNNLTTAWGVNAAYEHFWNKSWQTSIYGGYVATSYNTQANAILCSGENAGFVGGAANSNGGVGTAAVAAAGCNNNFAVWDIGTRTQWNVDLQTYIGLDVIYQDLKSATLATGTFIPTTGTQTGGLRPVADQNAVQAEFRVHRNFYP